MLKKLIKRQHGNALLLVSFALLGLLSVAGLVVDGGILYMTKSHLQKTANAVVLSGAQELTGTEAEVKKVVMEVLAGHNEEESLKMVTVALGSRIDVQLEKEVNLTFSRLFGRDVATVSTEAAAEIGAMGRAFGASPIGIDDSITLDYYVTYTLKVDQTGVESGVFGVLALGGPGANTYEDNLRNGYQAEIKIDDVLETQTGNISGKTRTVINEKVQKCPYSVGDAIERNCARIILIPVYKPHNKNTNQLKEVKITGFAYFFVTEPMNNNDTSITGMFIKRTGKGFIEPTTSPKGAYSIRLTK